MFFLWKFYSLNVDRYSLQLLYDAVQQSILSLGLICVFGNMRNHVDYNVDVEFVSQQSCSPLHVKVLQATDVWQAHFFLTPLP